MARSLKMAPRWEIRSSVSVDTALHSFFHLKNVERAGDPRSLTCCSVLSSQMSAIRKKKESGVAAGLECGVDGWACGLAGMAPPWSEIGLEIVKQSDYISVQER